MKTKKLTLAGMLIALATVLSFIKLFDMPYGGSVTAASMVPVIIFSRMSDLKWGLIQASVYGLIQLMIGWYAPPAQTVSAFLMVILLDYVFAFGSLGFAGAIYRKTGKGVLGTIISCLSVMSFRFLCHFASGILIWSSFAPEGQPVWLYSLLYNGGYMLGEAAVSLVVLLLVNTKLKEKL